VIGWLDHTGSLHASDFLPWWPLVFIAMGVAHLAATAMGRGGRVRRDRNSVPSAAAVPAHLRLSAILGVWPLLISVGGVS